MMVFISKVNNYMFRPKAAIFRLSQLQFCSKSVIYMPILHGDAESSSSYYMLQLILCGGMCSGSMNGGVWISLVGYILRGGSLWGGCDIRVVSMVLALGWWEMGGFVGLVCFTFSLSPSGLLFSAGVFCLHGSVTSAWLWQIWFSG